MSLASKTSQKQILQTTACQAPYSHLQEAHAERLLLETFLLTPTKKKIYFLTFSFVFFVFCPCWICSDCLIQASWYTHLLEFFFFFFSDLFDLILIVRIIVMWFTLGTHSVAFFSSFFSALHFAFIDWDCYTKRVTEGCLPHRSSFRGDVCSPRRKREAQEIYAIKDVSQRKHTVCSEAE